MSRWGDKKSLLRQRCAKGVAQLPSLQTKWIFTGMHALGGRWAVKLACHVQKLCTHSPLCKVPWQSMTLAGSMSFLLLAVGGSRIAPAAQHGRLPWEAELGEHQHLWEGRGLASRYSSTHQAHGDNDGEGARAVLAGNTSSKLLLHMLNRVCWCAGGTATPLARLQGSHGSAEC